MHEFGHTLGLGHSNDEMSAYMGASYPSTTFPRKCFNGYNNFHLGWYNDRKVDYEESMTSVKLVTFVDYDKTASDEPVIVNIDEKYFLQFNKKKDFNEETGDTNTWKTSNKVTIHTNITNEDTELIAALDVGGIQHLTNPNVFVKVCESFTTNSGAEGMFISFSKSSSGLCQDKLTFSDNDVAGDDDTNGDGQADTEGGDNNTNGDGQADAEAGDNDANGDGRTDSKGGDEGNHDGTNLEDLLDKANDFEGSEEDKPDQPPIDNRSFIASLMEGIKNFFNSLFFWM